MNLKTVRLIYNFNSKIEAPKMSLARQVEFNRKKKLILSGIKRLGNAYLVTLAKDLRMNTNTVRNHLIKLIESGEVIRVNLNVTGFFVKIKN